jgi:branched-chain amino acid transport system substrate-binding protein
LRRYAKPQALGLAIMVTLLGVACSEKTQVAGPDDTDAATTTVAELVQDCAAVDTIVECVPAGTLISDLLPDRATKATGTPIKIGTINQDTGAAGAFPELTVADKVAFEFINTELNGLDGHPLELITCDTAFDPNKSLACAQLMVDEGVLAVIGGIDIWGDGIKVLEDNGIPYVGGIPVSFNAARSPVSFQFSGGIWGAVLGEANYAVEELGAESIAIIHAEFGPITDAAAYGKRYLDSVGVESTIITVPPIGADMVSAMNQAAESDPDAIIALTADSGCVPTMQTALQLKLDAVLLLTGACAAPKIIESAGDDAVAGRIFNLEAELDPTFPDNALYQAIGDRYGPKFDYEVQGAGTVSFRGAMNLYAVLRELGADNATPAAIIELFRAAKDRPSFFGHPYTCDGQQLEGLPALCAPQQTLGRLDDGAVTQVTDWIDVGALV